MASNPLIPVRINALKYDIEHWRNVRQALTNKLYDAILMRYFFTTWQQHGYSDAVDGLPDDDPSTSQNEGVSETEFKQKAEGFFKKSWSQITDPNSDGVTLPSELQDDIAAIMTRVREIIAQQSNAGSMIDDINSEIQDLTIIQKQT